MKRIIIVAGFVALLIVSVLATSAFAQTYELSQDILATPTYLHYDLVQSTDQTAPPIRLHGTYDSAHAATNPTTNRPKLYVQLAGRTFTLGANQELTTNGDSWTLDLSRWDNDHPTDPMNLVAGRTYNGSVTAVLISHDSLGAPAEQSTSANFTVTIPMNPNIVGNNNSPTSGTNNPANGNNLGVWINNLLPPNTGAGRFFRSTVGLFCLCLAGLIIISFLSVYLIIRRWKRCRGDRD